VFLFRLSRAYCVSRFSTSFWYSTR